ncbi:DUF2083 domain-containing protein [Marivibrio halodurans]|uniref:DUF2083 domain-containing protein n=1 Tax=Marivibrio halodurans TaxID=2039722 RepID=A0A8J7V557_9PROT|nr:helix-turn-helix transcriptional regulator [Marivibrio halodurans]MBP5858484.1 DUF2083 domain-containing protein [Marivibrio halodurans]
MTRIAIGRRIRESRMDAGVTQTDLAKAIGISPSYLNLIEHDKRLIGGALLKRIAGALDTPLAVLSGANDAPLASEVAELARSLSFRGLDEAAASRFTGQYPDWANAFVQLHRRYRDATETALALSDRLSQDPALMELSHAVLTQISAIRSFAEIMEQYPDLEPAERERFCGIIADQSDRLGSSAREMIALLDGARNAPTPTSPQSEVDDFIHHCDNHLPRLEEAADALRARLETSIEMLPAAIENRLVRTHGLTIRRGRANIDRRDVRRHDLVLLDEEALDATHRFQLARTLADLELGDVTEELVADDRLTSDESRDIARRAMANYAAGALLFPYDAFHDEAEATRYDIDRLAQRFGGSFEQIAHRLVTLRRPDAQGVPFAFLRADPAGNISKPFSIAGLRMPRLGGACPLWAVYAAQATPDRTVSQLAEMPSGEQFLFIARSQSKRAPVYGRAQARFSVMLGCDVVYGERVVYFDSYASGRASLATPVGFNCRSCPRSACAQRAQAAIISAPTPPGGAPPAAPRMDEAEAGGPESREQSRKQGLASTART